MEPATPSQAVRPVWQFDTDGVLEGWSVYMNMTDMSAAEGALQATTTSHDPAFASPALDLRASDYKYLLVRMQATPAPGPVDTLQVFWSTPTQPASEANLIAMASSSIP